MAYRGFGFNRRNGDHRNIAEQIILQGGDYLMALKDNQPILKA